MGGEGQHVLYALTKFMFCDHSIGTIDEVNQEINMIWVQPRVLDINQVFLH